MSRPYDTIPRQGTHRDNSIDEAMTSNVRAQEPSHETARSKSTERVHVLLADPKRDRYRLTVRRKDEVDDFEDAFDIVDQVPKAGDVDRLYDQLPDQARHAVLEHTGRGDVRFVPERRARGDWTHDDMFDRVTIFTEREKAAAFAESRRESFSDA